MIGKYRYSFRRKADHSKITPISGLFDLLSYANKYEVEDKGDGKVTTIALFANPKTIAISSSKVKEVFSLSKSIDPFVHPCVKDAIIRKFTKEEFK